MKIKALFFFVCLCFVSTIAQADAVRDANRLLRVTNLGNRFDSMALDQTRKIIRTYSSIVNMSVALNLPQTIKNSIAACYKEVYSWDKFEPGIVQILAENLSQKELRLLIDFYSSRSLPPMEIDTFKSTVSKATKIERISIDYIFKHSDSCVVKDAALINEFLAEHDRVSSNSQHVIDTELPEEKLSDEFADQQIAQLNE